MDFPDRRTLSPFGFAFSYGLGAGIKNCIGKLKDVILFDLVRRLFCTRADGGERLAPETYDANP